MVLVASHILVSIFLGYEMKLKCKSKSCAKNVCPKYCQDCCLKSKKDNKLMRVLAICSHALSIYRTAKALGWLDSLAMFKEPISAALKFIYYLLLKFM